VLFSLPLLLILGCHELGHYLACRHHRIAATPPYFLPAPFGLGTLGAFIRVRGPIWNRRALFDVGIAGPLAGAVALCPFLLLGIAWSQPIPRASLASGALFLPGRSVLGELVLRCFHGHLGPGYVLDYHPFALAAWAGLLVTALNLLPVGQLDGGHLVYALARRHHRRVGLLAVVLLLLAGLWFWRGWWIWALITALLGARHPPVLFDEDDLGPGRRALALIALGLLVFCYMPTPVIAL
jgi:membrane-associated protease RseP (regulator of RpoE activity)